MSKLTGGLFSLGASGRLGPDIVFTRHGQTVVVRKYKPPTDNPNADQLARRSWFAECVLAWHQLTPAQKEEYRLVNPNIGSNAAYLNFMQEWLHMSVPLHKATHEKDATDELDVQDLASDQVGESDLPLLNLCLKDPPINLFEQVNGGTVAWTWLDVRPNTSNTVVAVLIGLHFSDALSAANATGIYAWDGANSEGQMSAKGYHINGSGMWAHGFITTNAGRIQYRIIASGGATATARVRLLGWFEPAQG